jgi:MSHA pilin protein MshA
MGNAQIKRVQSGFTLIELVVVIVILGILAATAIPRFVNMSTDARAAAVNGMAGALRSAVAITQARYLATGNNTLTEVLLQGQVALSGVVVSSGVNGGIPAGSSDGIVRALSATDGFTINDATATAVRFSPNDTATCAAFYNGTTGVVTTDVTAC